VAIKGNREEQVEQLLLAARDEEAMIPIDIRNRLEKYKLEKQDLWIYLLGKKRGVALHYELVNGI
jgi:hypothetical protein